MATELEAVARYRATRQKTQRRWVVAVIGLAVLGIVGGAAAGVALWRRGGPLEASLPISGPKAKVRGWLRENSDTGSWEEIRWSDYETKGRWGRIRLKYRTGAAVVDRWFIFDDPSGDIVETMLVAALERQHGFVPLDPDDFWGLREREERAEQLLTELDRQP